MTALDLEESVKLAFDRQARSYGRLYADGSHACYFFQLRKSKVLALLETEPRGKLLDIGCGPGMMVEPCVNLGFTFSGVDISDRMIAECGKKFAHQPNASFATGRVQDLGLRAEFGVVLCMGVLEYVPDRELDRAIDEMFAALAPGGLLVLSCLNAWSPFWRLHALERFPLAGSSEFVPIRPLREKLVRAILNRAGFVIESVNYFGFNLMPERLFGQFPRRAASLSTILEHMNSGNFRWLGLGFLAAARKP